MLAARVGGAHAAGHAVDGVDRQADGQGDEEHEPRADLDGHGPL